MQFSRAVRRFSSSLGKFAAGELVARLCALVLYAFTTRRFGVTIFGIVALAQTLSTYVTMLSDQGYKMIGARLIANNNGLTPYLVRIIVPRRVSLAVVASFGGCAYAFWGPMPDTARWMVASFAIAVIPASFAVDWILWGRGSFLELSTWKAVTAILSTGIAIGGMELISRPLWSISVGNFFAAFVGSMILWFLVVKPKEEHKAAIGSEELEVASSELRISKVLALGMSNILNLVFTNSDLVLLAAMTNTTEVGNYGSATKLVFVAYSGYYLLLNTLFPSIARVTDLQRLKRLAERSVGLLLLSGVLMAIPLAYFSPQILKLIYGPSINSTHLFRILILALPLELCTSLLGMILASQGYESTLLRCLLVAATLNVTVNLLFIPHFGAVAAAWSTVVSYGALWLLCVCHVRALCPDRLVATGGTAI